MRSLYNKIFIMYKNSLYVRNAFHVIILLLFFSIGYISTLNIQIPETVYILISTNNFLIFSFFSVFLFLKWSFFKDHQLKPNHLSYIFVCAILFYFILDDCFYFRHQISFDVNSILISFCYLLTANIVREYLSSSHNNENIKLNNDIESNKKIKFSFIVFITLLSFIINIDIQKIVVGISIIILLISLQFKNDSKNNVIKHENILILFISDCFYFGSLFTSSHIFSEHLSLFMFMVTMISIAINDYILSFLDFKNIQEKAMSLVRRMGELSMLHVEAHRAELSKENFLATMSHEIRTPVNGIAGHAQLLSITKIDDEQKRLLGMIITSTNNLMKLIDDVLDLPNLMAGNITIQEEKVSLAYLIESVIDVVTPKSFEKGLDLTYFIEPSVPDYVLCDSKRITQILMNLSNNALKFTEKGEVYLGVTQIDSISPNKVELLFEVKDTGLGISQDKVKRLFKAYSQTDASISRKYGGTGLGLAISSQLIEKMGGKIWVESVLGKGTRFLFSLKLTCAENKEEVKNNLIDFSGLKGLVISDNLTIRYILGRRFRQWKIYSKITNNYEEAQNLVGIDDFDFILVDTMIDNKKSIMFLKANKINSLGSVPSIALISIGKNTIVDLDKYTDFIIKKPLKTNVIYDIVKIIYENKKNKIIPIVPVNSNNNTSDIKPEENLEPKVNSDELLNDIKILVAEDNLVNQKLIMCVLKKLGYSAKLAENGKIAVEEVSKGNYDLILMDLQMPVMNGFEAARIIKDRSLLLKKIPNIVALTANAMLGDKEKCLNSGMDDYISKPLQINTISELIKKYSNEKLNSQKIKANDNVGVHMEEKKLDGLVEVLNDQDKLSTIVEIPVDKTNTATGVYNILVAEDNPINQKLIMSILKKLGHKATLVENGALAVEAVEKSNYEIILMDLQMPIMDGLEATTHILAQQNLISKPKIIALTANAMMGDRDKCISIGMSDYLSKPVQIKLLDETLKKWGEIKKSEAA